MVSRLLTHKAFIFTCFGFFILFVPSPRGIQSLIAEVVYTSVWLERMLVLFVPHLPVFNCLSS